MSMERTPFLLFEGDAYEPRGGMGDYQGAFVDLQSAIDYADRAGDDYQRDWVQVAMLIDGGLVAVLYRNLGPVWDRHKDPAWWWQR